MRIGRFLSSGSIEDRESDYHKKHLYKNYFGDWCICYSSLLVYEADRKIDACSIAKEGTNWTLGWGWSGIKPYCSGTKLEVL